MWDMSSLISGGYCVGVQPLPIPNREVKPVCADGTAMQCGRVGGRHLLKKFLNHLVVWGFFVYLQRKDGIILIHRMRVSEGNKKAGFLSNCTYLSSYLKFSVKSSMWFISGEVQPGLPMIVITSKRQGVALRR